MPATSSAAPVPGGGRAFAPMNRRAQDIFERSLDLEPGRRAAFVERQCGEDGALLREVRSLLDAHAAAGAFLKEPTVHPPTGQTGDLPATVSPARPRLADVEAQIGSVIGHFKLIELLGEGGFGRVYLAEQTSPVVRRVALKIIKLGMDTQQVVARFEQERQALAVMDHPGIARVLEAGSTPSGRPYFVMELVRGEPITRYCDRHRLSTRRRLELFIPVCAAVQHAHQKGIIHRDLKPGNVLVAEEDGRPVPKIIDFGIAKATSAAAMARAAFTEHRVFVGTPAYMSPEQAEPGVTDIDTRSDIYSLGVLLYELLTGSTPFDTTDLLSRGYEEIQRIIREVDPPRPSTRLSGSGESLAEIAARRGTEARRLGSQVRGELDWIVMKAMEKERHRRYDSAGSFARDVERYLSGQPVAAAPPSAAYRARKFIRRHRAAAGVAFILAVSLLAGLAGTLWQYRHALEQRDQARSEAARTERVAAFVVDALRAQDPFAGGRTGATIVEAMANAQKQVQRGDLDADPAVKAQVLRTMSGILRNNFQVRESLALAEEAAEIERTLHPGPHEHLADALRTVAMARLMAGDPAGARIAAEEALAMRRSLHPGDSERTANALNLVGSIHQGLREPEAARARYQEALEMIQRLQPGDSRRAAELHTLLAAARHAAGDRGGAGEMYERALAMYERMNLGDLPAVADAMQNWAVLRTETGDADAAESLFRGALDMRRRIFGPDHPNLVPALTNLASLLGSTGRVPEGIELATRADAIAAESLRPGDGRRTEARRVLETLRRLARPESEPAPPAADR